VLKRAKLGRGNSGCTRGEKSPQPIRYGALQGNTLKFRQSHGRTDGSKEPSGRAGGEQHLRFLRKGNRGMPVKPILWFAAGSKTPKGSKAQERMISGTSGS
jgi:hypothetical protein